MAERIFPARVDQLEQVQRFIVDQLQSHACSEQVLFQLEVAVEEIFVNIASYAYPAQSGEAVVRCTVNHNPLQVSNQFEDGGTPFNPLEREDPDITLSAEERRIGGLGLLMVKKSMDGIHYEYRNGKNILTIEKQL